MLTPPGGSSQSPLGVDRDPRAVGEREIALLGHAVRPERLRHRVRTGPGDRHGGIRWPETPVFDSSAGKSLAPPPPHLVEPPAIAARRDARADRAVRANVVVGTDGRGLPEPADAFLFEGTTPVQAAGRGPGLSLRIDALVRVDAGAGVFGIAFHLTNAPPSMLTQKESSSAVGVMTRPQSL
jgi:hypothetical protein